MRFRKGGGRRIDIDSDSDINMSTVAFFPFRIVQAAIAEAFKTPEVIRMFALQQPKQLRERLESLRRDSRLGRAENNATTEMVEILVALKKLGEQVGKQSGKEMDSGQLDWCLCAGDDLHCF